MKPKVLPKFIVTVTAILWAGLNMIYAQPLGIFFNRTDVGAVKHPGSVTYDSCRQIYTLTGSGKNMWFDKDDFSFLWKKVSGDFILRARVHFIGKGVDKHRKTGWTIRKSLDPASPQVSAVVHGNGLASLQFRKKTGGITEEIQLKVNEPDVIRLEKRGDNYIFSAACYGALFESVQVKQEITGDSLFAGLFVCAHSEDVTEKAIFENVRVVYPATAGFVPYRDFLGSHLEVMDIKTGHREILFTVPYSIQAPNWTKDGNYLVYNSKGLLYRFNIRSHQPALIPTKPVQMINNDHVLSFNGRMLGISSDGGPDIGSLVYVLPAQGGRPRKVTKLGPSYLHGWSPDGKYLVFVGRRNSDFDIYRIPFRRGKEVRLTTAKGLDDGPEYSPDGKYIYFNSNRTGTMQIWRMQPDGSHQEQMTFDELNDWFPHISPDGKKIVFITFPKEVGPGDHPFYKRVYLRTIPADGGNPRVLAYLYGGQGTINVPGWSPDGKKIAFVSNTGIK